MAGRDVTGRAAPRRSLRRAVSAPPAASPEAEAWAARLIDDAASIRLAALFRKSSKAGDRSLYRGKTRRSIQAVAIETSALRGEELVDIMRYRLAQYLAVRFVDVERIYRERIEHEPLEHSGPNDVHIIAGDVDSGEILSYLTIKEAHGALPGMTFRDRDRPLFPVEEVHGWGVFNRLENFPDLELTRVREAGRFVKNQRYASLDERSIRAPIETSLALWRVVELEMPGVDACVGDFEEGIAQARLAYFHVPMAVVHGTVPYESETAWLYRRYQHRTVFPFAVLMSDLPAARARGKSIDRAMSLPGKLALIRLSQLRKYTSTHRSSLEPADGLPALDEAVVLRQPEVAMADRLALITEGLRLRSAPLFADLSVAEAAVLGTKLERVQFAEGETIITEGDVGDALYVIETGEVEALHHGRRLATLGVGDHFGEIALIDGGTRTADVIATTAVSLLRLDRDVYLDYLAALPDVMGKAAASTAARRRRSSMRVSTPGVFQDFTSAPMSVMGAQMQSREFARGETIIRQGDAGDVLYFIVVGKADVIVHGESGRSSLVATLDAGEFFGEIALLDNVPRNASVVARTRMRIMQLDRDGLEAFLRYSESVERNMRETARRRADATAELA
jgi:CRP-like cAMP-binding protein